MTNDTDKTTSPEVRQKALSRWDDEGGAARHTSPGRDATTDHADVPPLTNAELVQLRVRMIAVENLMIMLLAQGSDQQFEHAREMAAYISPRPGFTHHPLTLRAGEHMIDLVDRAIHYRNIEPS